MANMIATGSEATSSTAFLVIQNPIAVSTTELSSSPSVNWFEPNLWLGLLGILLLLGTAGYLLQMIVQFIQLKKMEYRLDFQPLCQCSRLVSTLPSIDKFASKTQIAFSASCAIPFTYGWRNTKIVIPENLKNDTDSLCMAVQHELMHIKHRDYLLNSINIFLKAIFWFHPLIHFLYKSSHDFREITCDTEVLATQQFSKKKYASLLYELAKREHHIKLAMSMAVNPSSLKKRIQIMTSQSNVNAKFRSSLLLTLISAVFVVLAISCTDMANDGITNSELEQAQSTMQSTTPQKVRPLYILNGEEVTSDDQIQKLSRLKSKYIKSINVLKAEKATNKYGETAKNGVIELYVWEETKEKAFTDLKPQNSDGSVEDLEHQDFFMAVEQMPQLKGGLGSIQKEIRYPEMARKAGIEGRVIIQFIVNKEGKVENPQVIRGIGGGCDKEAVRVTKMAEFVPGKQSGKAVRVQFSLPITFRLQGNENSSNQQSSVYKGDPIKNQLQELAVVGYM